MPTFADPALYILERDGELVLILQHLDDIFVSENDMSQLEDTETKILKNFEARTIDNLRNFLATAIESSNNK